MPCTNETAVIVRYSNAVVSHSLDFGMVRSGRDCTMVTALATMTAMNTAIVS